MAVFTEQLFTSPFAGGAGPVKGLELRNEEFIRPFGFGNNWSKLRIAVLMGLGQTLTKGLAGTILPVGLVDIGVCSGTRRGIGSANPVNYIGVGYGGAGGARYGGNAGNPLRGIELPTLAGGWTASGSENGNATHYRTAQHGLVVDSYFYSRSQGSIYFYGPNSAVVNGVYRRGMLVAEFRRVSGVAYTASLYAVSAQAVSACDFTLLNLVDACESSNFVTSFTTPVYSFVTSALSTLTYDQQIGYPVPTYAYTDSAGPLDCVNIAWNQSICALTIWGVAVARYPA